MATPQEKAASTSKNGNNTQPAAEYEEELDFFSAKFNPERALQSSAVSVPYPNIKSFEDVNSYEDAVHRVRKTRHRDRSEHKEHEHKHRPKAFSKGSDSPGLTMSRHSGSLDRHQSHRKSKEQRDEKPSRSSSTSLSRRQESDSDEATVTHASTRLRHKVLNPPDSERPKTDAQKFMKRSSHQVETPADHGEGSSTSAEKRSKRAKKRNVFTRMEAMSGPLRLLTRCVQERLQVRVMTRSAVHVRGICRGYIVAFDKYFNMAMIDVDEIFRRPVNQGKIKSRITHKLLAAQKTLKKEREECVTKWKADQDAKNEDVAVTSSNLQGLSILPDVNVTDLHNILSTVSQMQGSQPASTTATAAVCEQASVSSDTSHPTSSHSQSSKPQSSSTSSATKQESTSSISRCESKDEKEAILQKLSKVSQKKFKRIQSVYEDLKAPLSPFEREALMLGIPDENVDHRHVSQLFIRGENVVMINIIDD